MKLLIAGSRAFSDYNRLILSIDSVIDTCSLQDVTIVSGGSRGADALAERYAKEFKLPFELYPAKWKLYGNSAGMIRNEEMGRASDMLIAFWDGQSRGTKHMISYILKLSKPVFVVMFNITNIPVKISK